MYMYVKSKVPYLMAIKLIIFNDNYTEQHAWVINVYSLP